MPWWMRSYGLMVRWTALRLRTALPLFGVVQIALGVGTVIGFGYLMPAVDRRSALFLSTGGATIGLIMLGMVIAPQVVAQNRAVGGDAFDLTLPVPRMATLAADLTVWGAVGLPGIGVSLLVATTRYDLDLHAGPLVVPAFLLVMVTATAVGYGFAHALPPPLVGLVCQVLAFVAMMFAPVSFPADRLPGWLQAVHEVLPLQYMATAVRASLAGEGGVDVVPFVVLAGWATAGLALAYLAMIRRT